MPSSKGKLPVKVTSCFVVVNIHYSTLRLPFRVNIITNVLSEMRFF